MNKLMIGIIGSGNWGSTVSKILAENVVTNKTFEENVRMWVVDEQVNGQLLSQIINQKHENPKYLPGIKLPTNVVAVTDLSHVGECSHLVFVLPHQFLENVCIKLKPLIRKDAIAISLVKGLLEHPTEIVLPSQIIKNTLNIDVSVLSGANIANEIADEKLSTTTIGSNCPKNGLFWQNLFIRPYFKVDLINFTIPVEIFGALKNVVALGVGFSDGLNLGNNAKATLIRIGFLEIVKFVSLYQNNCAVEVFLGSFGLDDLITTCIGGRNVRAAEQFIKTDHSIEQIEQQLLNGQKLQGPSTAYTVFGIIKSKSIEKEFPFFSYIHGVLTKQIDSKSIGDVFENKF